MVAPLAGANALSKSIAPYPIEASTDAKAAHAAKDIRAPGAHPAPGSTDETESRSFDQILGALLDKVERAGREGDRASAPRSDEPVEVLTDSKRDTRGQPRPAHREALRSERPERTERTERTERSGQSDSADDEADVSDGEMQDDARNGKRISRRRTRTVEDIPPEIFLGTPIARDFAMNSMQGANACSTASTSTTAARNWLNGAFAHETSVTGTFTAIAPGENDPQNGLAAAGFGRIGNGTTDEPRVPGHPLDVEKSAALDRLALQQSGILGTPEGSFLGMSGLASDNRTRSSLDPLLAQSGVGTLPDLSGVDGARGLSDPLMGAPRFDSVEATFIGVEDGLQAAAVLRQTHIGPAPSAVGGSGIDTVALALAASQGRGPSEPAALDAARVSDGLALMRTEMSRTVVMGSTPPIPAPAAGSGNASEGTGALGSSSFMKISQREVSVALPGEESSGLLTQSDPFALETSAQRNPGEMATPQAQTRANPSDLTSRIFMPRRDMAALHADIATLRSQVKEPTYTDEDVLTDSGLALAFSASSQSHSTGDGNGANGSTQSSGSPSGVFGNVLAQSQGGPQLDFSNRGGGRGESKERGSAPFFARETKGTDERTLGRLNENGTPFQSFGLGTAAPSQGANATGAVATPNAIGKTNEASDAAAARSLTKAALERAQDQAADLQARGGGMAKVQIRDARLGDVGLRVNMGGDGKVHVEITTADERVKKEIEKGLDELKASLEKNNLQVGEVKVIDDAGRTRDQGNQQQSQNPWQGSGANPDGNGRASLNQQGNGRDGRDGTTGTDGGLTGSAYGQKKGADAENSAGAVRQRNVQRGNNGSLKVFA